MTTNTAAPTNRHLVWSDVSRLKPPPLGADGRRAKAMRWAEAYEGMSKTWERRGDLDQAVYYQGKANEKWQEIEKSFGR